MFFAAVIGAEDLHIASGESGIAQALGHRFGGGSGAADGVGGIDFDELSKNKAGPLPGRFIRTAPQAPRRKGRKERQIRDAALSFMCMRPRTKAYQTGGPLATLTPGLEWRHLTPGESRGIHRASWQPRAPATHFLSRAAPVL